MVEGDGLASPRLVGLGPKNRINMKYVYIIYSKVTGKLYKGITSNIETRLNDHNGSKVRSTKSGVPWILVYFEAFINDTDAGREEIFLKTGKGKERIKFLLENTIRSLQITEE